MLTIVYYAAALILYAAGMAAMIAELADIRRNPEKHDEIPGWSRYRHSFWFEYRGEYHRFLSKHYWAGILFGIPFVLGCFAALYAAALWLHQALFIPEGVTRLRTDGVTAAMIPGLFWLICFESWLSYHSSRPVAIAQSMHFFGGSRRVQKLKASIFMVIATAVFVPALALGVESYAYATEEGFVVNRYFSVTDTRAAYADCAAETTWRFNRQEDEAYFAYVVTLPDGTPLDLVQACGDDWVRLSALHERLASAGVELRRKRIDKESWATIQTLENDENLAYIETYFNVDAP